MNTKTIVHSHCLQLLNDKIHALGELILDAQSASNNDTKSSMGDKYETTREMMQIEINKLNQQLYEAQQMLLAIKVLNPKINYQSCEAGALVVTNNITFYISTGLGRIEIKGNPIVAISSASPMGKIMHGKKKDDTFILNTISYKILAIE